ncbi:hypothetical protein JD844_023128 [Phrynosoma platyrhinos]|uniref:Uncharacterized protein n=1 Tax=Phrynosoma platyrhinos TaxID=52577 RepID=A0ABQ7SWG0_PHRPL|nr:hypothetical protein JD844_023128 [Phrynosoma platyrhinos]
MPSRSKSQSGDTLKTPLLSRSAPPPAALSVPTCTGLSGSKPTSLMVCFDTESEAEIQPSAATPRVVMPPTISPSSARNIGSRDNPLPTSVSGQMQQHTPINPASDPWITRFPQLVFNKASNSYMLSVQPEQLILMEEQRRQFHLRLLHTDRLFLAIVLPSPDTVPRLFLTVFPPSLNTVPRLLVLRLQLEAKVKEVSQETLKIINGNLPERDFEFDSRFSERAQDIARGMELEQLGVTGCRKKNEEFVVDLFNSGKNFKEARIHSVRRNFSHLSSMTLKPRYARSPHFHPRKDYRSDDTMLATPSSTDSVK